MLFIHAIIWKIISVRGLAIASFGRSVPPPICCGFPYDHESEVRPPGKAKNRS
jgi:hypothetical protein